MIVEIGFLPQPSYAFDGVYSGCEKINYSSTDSLRLVAVHCKSDNINASKGTVLMIHGIRARKEYMISRAEILAQQGYDVVIPDLRAHGESEGEYCTFGYHEKQDLSHLIDRFPFVENWGIWGVSLGGAVTLQALEAEKRLKFGIVESTFSDFQNIVHDYTAYHAGFNIPFITDYAIKRSGKLASFNPDEIVPKKSCENIKQPVLLIHGEKDRLIKMEYGKENFKGFSGNNVEFIAVPEAGHRDVLPKGGQELILKIQQFLREHQK